jgi:hypothetical protein
MSSWGIVGIIIIVALVLCAAYASSPR